MKQYRNWIAVALLGAGFATLGAAGASAGIACNDEGDCWHTKTVIEYPREAHITVHDDQWRWRDGDHYGWREHEGRGFWRGRVWNDF